MPNQRRSLIVVALLIANFALPACVNGPPPTDVELGELALARGDWRQAKIHFAIALNRDSRNGRAWLGQAKAEVAGRDPEAALRSIKSLAQVDPATFQSDSRATYADALHGAAAARLAQKQTPAALVAARALAKLDPERTGLVRLMGDTLLAEAGRLRLVGQPKAAFTLFREAAQIAPQRLDAWIGAAEIMIESNRGKDAVRLLEAGRRYHPTSREIRMLSIQAVSAR